MSEEPGRLGTGYRDEPRHADLARSAAERQPAPSSRPPQPNGPERSHPVRTGDAGSPAELPWVAPAGPAAPGFTRPARFASVAQRSAMPPLAQRAAAGSPYRPVPGGIPLRPLDLGDLLDGTFTTIRRNPKATVGISAVLVAVQQLLVVGTGVLTGDIPTAGSFASQETSLQLIGGGAAVLGLLLSAVVGAILTGMIVVVVFEDVLGNRVTVGTVWRRVRPRLAALIGAAVLAGVLPFVGLALLVVPGVILWGAWALTTPALILEGLGPVRALRRSWRLAWPDFWRVWGIRALSVGLGWVMQNLVALPFAFLGGVLASVLGASEDAPLPLPALALVVVGGILGGAVAEPFLAGVVALLYVDRRMRAEGLDIVLQQQSRLMGRRAGMAGAGEGFRAEPGGAGPGAVGGAP